MQGPDGMKRVLMLGTDLGGRGGVATVVSLLRQDGLFEREGVLYVPTHVEGTRAARVGAALKGLVRTLACLARRPELVHAHAASKGSFVRKSVLLALARARGCKTVFHLHGACFDSFIAGASPSMRRWIRHTLEHSSVVIALSSRWAGFLREFAPRARVVVIPNSVPLPPMGPDQVRPGRILFLGQVEPRKGVMELVQALALLKERFPHAQLAIGGQGELEQVERRARALGVADRVLALGWVTAEKKQQELARAAIFCLPSHAEGLPMALLEAMAAGKAVVTTGVGGIPDAVRDGDNGLLVAPGNVEQLAAALGRLLADEDESLRLGARARTTIEEQFESGFVIGQLSAVYRQLRRAGEQ
ncbi:glycosyltransferase family 4 protein [Massilia yuzhufengensis]|uniref:Glycosyltransferase involved in cell wall bisynthesis n=1 Tax=Massilia yuzhufengensis TaxID=1164594 RepID=A0A1I1PHP6_9BURK|nr:glycosyltransferase family 4 protein [Massilia yuzhufengensis]SFD06523.1 Glycosyltransferase involved in cell wall bisynthesis [Massilia yuzhufengensis]